MAQNTQSEKSATSEENTQECCSKTPSYEITYNHISRKWLVCYECLELEFFNTGIKEKVRIK